MTLFGVELNVTMAGNYTWPWKDGLILFGTIFNIFAPGWMWHGFIREMLHTQSFILKQSTKYVHGIVLQI